MQPGSAMPPSNSSAGGQAEVPKDLAQYLNGDPQYDLRVPSIVGKQPLFQPLTIADTFTDGPSKPLNNLQNRDIHGSIDQGCKRPPGTLCRPFGLIAVAGIFR